MKKRSILEMNRLSKDEFKKIKKSPLTIVLDNVRSLHNIGSIFRTADAFLMERILLCGISSPPPHPELHKTALGAEDTVDWMYFHTTAEAINFLKAENYCIYAIEQAENSISLETINLDNTKSYAIVLGNEVKGVQQEIVDRCDSCIEIPQFGTKHSLNVSVASGIVLWTFFQKLQKH
jgi:23S rRNA (guanosine2251-2'-O)-methyltransferase